MILNIFWDILFNVDSYRCGDFLIQHGCSQNSKKKKKIKIRQNVFFFFYMYRLVIERIWSHNQILQKQRLRPFFCYNVWKSLGNCSKIVSSSILRANFFSWSKPLDHFSLICMSLNKKNLFLFYNFWSFLNNAGKSGSPFMENSLPPKKSLQWKVLPTWIPPPPSRQKKYP